MIVGSSVKIIKKMIVGSSVKDDRRIVGSDRRIVDSDRRIVGNFRQKNLNVIVGSSVNRTVRNRPVIVGSSVNKTVRVIVGSSVTFADHDRR